MEHNLPWNTTASPIGHFEDGSNNITQRINIYSRSGQVYPVDLFHHNCSEGPCFAISPSANHLIVRDSLPMIARPGVQTTVLDHGNSHGIDVPHRLAQEYRTAGPSSASAGARDGLFHGNLQHNWPLQDRNLWETQYPQPHAWTAPNPHTRLFQDQPGSGLFGSMSEENNLSTAGLPVLGARGNPLDANARPIEHGFSFDSEHNGVVQERFEEDHHDVDLSQSNPSFDYTARYLSPHQYASSTRNILQETLGPKSMESVEAHRAAMAEDLGHISESSQTEDNHTGGYICATNRKPYRSQASEPVPEHDGSMLKSDWLLGEGYGHRDSQDIFQETHTEPVPQGLARQEARAGKRSQAPGSVTGSPSHPKRPRGKRTGPLTPEGKAHANRVKKGSRKGCIHKRKRQKCTCDDVDDDQPFALGSATQPANALLQPRGFQDDAAYGSPSTQTSLNSSFFTGPTTNTRSTPSRHPSFVSYDAMSTPADTNQLTALLRDNLGTDFSQSSHKRASIDNNHFDAPGDTDDEAM